MAAKDIRAGRAFVELSLKSKAFIRGLRNASKRLKSFGKSIGKVGAVVSGFGSAVTGTLAVALKSFASYGDQLDKTSARTGVSAAALAELSFAAEQSGASMEILEKGLFGLSRSLFDAERGSAEAVDALAKIGLRFTDLRKMSPEKQLEMVADAMTNIADVSVRGAVAQKLLGRAGRQLLPMVESLRALRQEAKDLGLAPDPEDVKAAAEVVDTFNRIRRTIKMVVFEVGAGLAKSFGAFAKKVVAIAVSVKTWVRENRALVATIFKVSAAVVLLGTVITGVGLAVAVLGVALGGIASAISILLSPLVLIGAALAAGVALWLNYTESGKKAVGAIKDAFVEMGAVFLETWNGIKDAIGGGDLALAGEIAMAGLRLAIVVGINKLVDFLKDTFGEFTASFAGRILSGDFAGAWRLAIKGMASVWAQFSEGLVKVFTVASRGIIKIWSAAVKKLRNLILESASEGGMGQIFLAGTGVNLAEEKRKATLGRAEDLRSANRRLSIAQGAREKLAADPGAILSTTEENFFNAHGGGRVTVEELDKMIDDYESTIARLNGMGSDFFITNMEADADRAFDKQIAGWNSKLDSWDRAAEARTDAAGMELDDEIKVTSGAGDKEAERLRAELDALLEKSRAVADAAKMKKKEEVEEAAAGVPGGDEVKGTISGSFSAAALAVMGNRSPMERLHKEVAEGVKVEKGIRKAAEGVWAAIKEMVFI